MDNWTVEEIAIAENAVSTHRSRIARENYQAARLEYFLQIENGDSIDFLDRDHRQVVSGIVTARGTEAGWATVAGCETRFDFMDVVTIWRDGEAV